MGQTSAMCGAERDCDRHCKKGGSEGEAADDEEASWFRIHVVNEKTPIGQKTTKDPKDSARENHPPRVSQDSSGKSTAVPNDKHVVEKDSYDFYKEDDMIPERLKKRSYEDYLPALPCAEPLYMPPVARTAERNSSKSESVNGKKMRSLPSSKNGNFSRRKNRMTQVAGAKVVASKALQVIIENQNPIRRFYDIGAMLGQGAFGQVKKAVVKATKATRAVKVISKEKMKDHLWSLRREMDILKMLDHPNNVKLYEIFEDDEFIYLVMELCSGSNLAKRCGSHVFSERESAHTMQQILRGVYYLHGKRICHRDLKPENCLICQNVPIVQANIKIVDFGLSCLFRPGVPLTSTTGTAYCMAPEVFGEKYDHKCDLWSCGIIAYYTLAANTPFEGSREEETKENVKKGRFNFGKEFVDASPESMDFIENLLTKDPTRRASARDALRHTWLKKKVLLQSTVVALQVSTISSLRGFRKLNRLKRAALSIAVSMLTEEDLRDTMRLFISLDDDGDGLLSLGELTARLKAAGAVFVTDVEDIFEDTDQALGINSFSYTEFLAATIDWSKCLTETISWAAFCSFDKDGDGTISIEELTKGHLLGHISMEELSLTLHDLDSNGDSNVDFSEFLAMMKANTGAPAE
eukprot:TRINITY_DN42235_c0_g1_i1.p1 TRINITY_DN42235_c0_g1~~TRINITY_DN42235_c0_g1_i1.p1  ORF type:complete len:636 (+),score=121.83 TRINITY_DN42235_c0_g1_i1:134-2041(+)